VEALGASLVSTCLCLVLADPTLFNEGVEVIDVFEGDIIHKPQQMFVADLLQDGRDFARFSARQELHHQELVLKGEFLEVSGL